MYMIKAQRKLADIEKKEKEQKKIEALGGLKIVQGAVSPDIPTDGPKGAKKKVKYIGSFKVYPPPGLSGQALNSAISDFVWDKAGAINPKRVTNPVSGTLMVNRYGIRLYKDKKVFMSYPIKKISYCTAIPRQATFAIVTRQDDVTYCHMFSLSDAEQASELSQYMSHAFKLAVAQSTLRRLSKDKDKDKRKSKTPWEVLTKKDKKKDSSSPSNKRSSSPNNPPRSTSPSNLSAATSSSSKESKSKNRKSHYLNPPPPVAPGYSPEPERRVASTDITVEGLEAEIMLLEQQIASAETQLQSMPPESEATFEMIIQLSANEDKLKVRQQQLVNLQQMTQIHQPPPYNEPPSVPPPATAPSLHTTSNNFLPPSYDDMFGGGAVGGGSDETVILEDAEWYQAGLPRDIVMDLLSYQPAGTFYVRDSTSNPGCHALSVKSPDGSILHYLIAKDRNGYFIQGCSTRHESLLKLVTHHASVVEFIPTLLSLGSTNPLANPYTLPAASTAMAYQQPPPIDQPLPPPPQGGGIYPWLLGDDDDSDDEMADDVMVQQLQELQLINP